MTLTIPLRAVPHRSYSALPFDPSLFCLHDGGDREDRDPDANRAADPPEPHSARDPADRAVPIIPVYHLKELAVPS